MHYLTHQTSYDLLDTTLTVQFEVEIYALPQASTYYDLGSGADFHISDVIEWASPQGKANELTGAQRAFLINLFWDDIADHIAQYAWEH